MILFCQWELSVLRVIINQCSKIDNTSNIKHFQRTVPLYTHVTQATDLTVADREKLAGSIHLLSFLHFKSLR